ncbi:alpha/beta hydrolase [Acidobacteria bacterium Mor1]|nr:alpha/beta hydrolase [Acidobacteria bacterium Mor1]
MFGKMVSDMMVKPHQSPLFDDPANYGMDYENVSFQTEDGVTLRGWMIDGGSDRVVIQTHFGVQCNRAGYDPKGKGLIKMWKRPIAFLRQARHFQQNGYSVLMYDMRNHGESDLGTCPWISWGPEEAKDVIAATRFVSDHPRYQQAEIGLLGICMGSVSTTYAFGMGKQGLGRFENIKATVAVQPLHYREFVKAFGMPGFLNRAGGKTSLERLGFDLNERTFMSDVHHITLPTMVIQNRNDPWTDPALVQRYYDQLGGEKELLWLDLAKSRAAAYDYLGTNPEVLTRFFDHHLGTGAHG